MSTTTCEKCGKADIQVGEWPFCPHGFPERALSVIGDEIDETHENLGHDAVHFSSKSEKRRYLKEHGLVEFVRHIGEQGSDKSSKTQRWV